jgi:WD40 repeat protein
MPDGRHVLVAAGQETTGTSDILVVDTRTGAVTKRLVAPGAPSEVAPDPTGRWIAAGGQDGLLRFFSVSTGRLLAPPQEAVGGQVYNVSVSPDGRYVATTGAPGEVRLWDTTTFRQVGPDLPSPISGGDARVRFAPDGSLVGVFSPDPPPSDQNMAEPVTAGSGHDLRHGAAIWIYPVGRAAWVKQACGTVGRQLTRDEWNTYLPELAYDPACG